MGHLFNNFLTFTFQLIYEIPFYQTWYNYVYQCVTLKLRPNWVYLIWAEGVTWKLHKE